MWKASKNFLFVAALTAVLFPPSTYAGEGGTLLPSWFKDSSPNSTSVFLSNISNEEVTVFIELFEETGEPYNDDSEPGSNFLVARGFSGDPLCASGATLPANTTGEFRVIGTGPTETGYGRVKWSSVGNSKFALVGHVRQTFSTPSGISIFPLNHYRPF